MRVLSGSVRESPLPETAVASMNCGRRLRSVVLLHAPQRRHSCDSRPHPPVTVPLEQLLGDAEEALAPVHLLPDVLRIDTRVRPENDEVVNEVGAPGATPTGPPVLPADARAARPDRMRQAG